MSRQRLHLNPPKSITQRSSPYFNNNPATNSTFVTLLRPTAQRVYPQSPEDPHYAPIVSSEVEESDRRGHREMRHPLASNQRGHRLYFPERRRRASSSEVASSNGPPELEVCTLLLTISQLTHSVHMVCCSEGKKLKVQNGHDFAVMGLYWPIETLSKEITMINLGLENWGRRISIMAFKEREFIKLGETVRISTRERINFFNHCLENDVEELSDGYVHSFSEIVHQLNPVLEDLSNLKDLLAMICREGNDSVVADVTVAGQSNYDEEQNESTQSMTDELFNFDALIIRPPTPRDRSTPSWKHELRNYGIQNLYVGPQELELCKKVLRKVEFVIWQTQKLMVRCEKLHVQSWEMQTVFNGWYEAIDDYFRARNSNRDRA
ncbi:MAG: hypothetical protein M1827_003211 [Pycnora praestabilis]|nr:MAG: hypothetical protein M1827_003211 [Pycnora praestabilis]